METLQERSDATKEAIALAVDNYKQTIDAAVNGETVDWGLLESAVPTLTAQLTPLVGAEDAERILDKLYAESVADGL